LGSVSESVLYGDGSSTQELEHPYPIRDHRQVRGHGAGRVGSLRRRLPRPSPLRRPHRRPQRNPRLPVRVPRNRCVEAPPGIPKRHRFARVLLARRRRRRPRPRVPQDRLGNRHR